MKEFVRSAAGVHAPVGRYSHCVRVGNTIYLAGQVALNERGELVGRGDIRAQTEQVFRNIQALLAACGASLEDLVKITNYLVREEDIAPYLETRAQFLTGEPPASTLLVVSRLASPDFLVEVEGIAVVDGQ